MKKRKARAAGFFMSRATSGMFRQLVNAWREQRDVRLKELAAATGYDYDAVRTWLRPKSTLRLRWEFCQAVNKLTRERKGGESNG